MRQSVRSFTKADLERIAREPGNTVLEVDEAACEPAAPVDHVERTLEAARVLAQSMFAADESLSDSDARKRITTQDADARKIADTHEKMFAVFTARASTDELLGTVRAMFAWRRSVERGELDHATVSDMIYNQRSRT